MKKVKRLALSTLMAASLGIAAAQQNTLNFATAVEPPTLDPNKMLNGFTFGITTHVFETLLKPDGKGGVMAGLALPGKRLTPTTWRLSLRKNVQFQDGTPFNAQAVKYSLERLISPAYGSSGGHLLGMIKTVNVVDDYTIDITTSYPFAALMANLSHPVTAIVSPKAAKGADFGKNPVGTGPFKFGAWNANQQIELVANPTYWGGKPQIDKVVFRFIPDGNAQVDALQKGQVDFINAIPIDKVKSLENNPNLELEKQQSFTVTYVGFNTKNGITKDLKVRQAIAQAINKDMIMNTLRQGLVTKTNSLLAGGIFGANTNVPQLGYNPTKAKALLSQAGIKPGTTIRLTTWLTPEYTQVAEAIRVALQPLGLKVEVKVLPDYDSFSSAMQKPDHSEIFLTGWATVTLDADYTLFTLTHSKEIPENNWAFYKNTKVDDMLAKARHSGNQDERRILYDNIQNQLAADLPVFPLYSPSTVYAKNKKLQGDKWMYAWIFMDFQDAYIK